MSYHLDRDSYALVFVRFKPKHWVLLDEWSSIEFDAKTSILRMMVYRPVGKYSRSVQCGSVKLTSDGLKHASIHKKHDNLMPGKSFENLRLRHDARCAA